MTEFIRCFECVPWHSSLPVSCVAHVTGYCLFCVCPITDMNGQPVESCDEFISCLGNTRTIPTTDGGLLNPAQWCQWVSLWPSPSGVSKYYSLPSSSGSSKYNPDPSSTLTRRPLVSVSSILTPSPLLAVSSTLTRRLPMAVSSTLTRRPLVVVILTRVEWR